MSAVGRSDSPAPHPWWSPREAPQSPRAERLADDFLARCRGEGPANCVNRCPLEVDARGYVQLTAQGRFADALQLVREKLPFPGILGYVCAHPCELHCKRIDEDGAVRIRDIKRFLAEREDGAPRHILECEPDRGVAVAVVGAGPAGLLAAHDLRRRGYAVTVFEKDAAIGGCLTGKIPAWRLPRAVALRDLSVIAALGIAVRTGVEVGRDVALSELRRQFAAVLLLPGFAGAGRLLAMLDEERPPARGRLLAADPVTCETGLPGVFAGGDAVSGPATVISSLALGRRAAASAHRFLSGTDLRADALPAVPRPLLWRLDIDEAERKRRERTPVMLQPFAPPLGEEEAVEEAKRCLDCSCGLCVKDCEFLTSYCRSPKELARQVKAGVKDALKMVYSCNICSLCAEVCPVDLDTGAMLLAARQQAVREGVGPLPAHKPIVSYYRAGVGSTFTLAMAEPGRQHSKRLFFTGCALPAVSPRNTLAVYDELRRNFPGTGVLMFCCGAPAELIGMEGEFERTCRAIREHAERLGAEELITACPDCTHTLKTGLPELKITTVWEALAGRWSPPALRAGARVAIHDSCKAHHEPATHDGVRALVASAGAVIEDVEYAREKARCCGNGGMIYPVDPKLAQRVIQRRAGESPLPMITYCAGCRSALASGGKESIHILDFLLNEGDLHTVARRKPTGSIARYANRLRTKWAFRRLQPPAAR
ncbi:MAG: heterodisulfide reductase-related iron-sulfur binding cluster [Thermoanaerobaculaceae bacterium]|nr:heterodisulfide reductase-related iron-sulfur binding cluster [Thermoanaerobaculaceae bacterium]